MKKQLDIITFTSNFNNLDVFLAFFTTFLVGDNRYIDSFVYGDKLDIIKEKTKIYTGSVGKKIIEYKVEKKSLESIEQEIIKYEQTCKENNILNIVLIDEDKTDDFSKGLRLLDKDVTLPNTGFKTIFISPDIKLEKLKNDLLNTINSMGYEIKKGSV